MTVYHDSESIEQDWCEFLSSEGLYKFYSFFESLEIVFDKIVKKLVNFNDISILSMFMKSP